MNPILKKDRGLTIIFVVSLLAFLVFSYLNKKSPQQVHEYVSDRLTTLLDQQGEDLIDFENQLSVYSNPFAISFDQDFPKRVYVNGSLVFWTDNKYWPEYSALKESDTLYVYKDDFGTKIIRRHEVLADRELIEIFSIIPVSETPPVANQYLSDGLNEKLFGSYSVVLNGSGSHLFTYRNLPLFSAEIAWQSNPPTDWLGLVFLLTIASCVFLFCLRNLIFQSVWYRFGLLVAILFALRTIIHLYTTFQMTSWSLFDPVNLTFGVFLPSLGDLLLHACFSLVVLILSYRWISVRKIPHLSVGLQRLIYAIASFVHLFLGFLLYRTVWLVLEHSQLNLDINSSIDFDFLRVMAFLFLFLGGFCILIAFSLLQKIVRELGINYVSKLIIFLPILVILGLLDAPYSFIYLGAFGIFWWVIDFFKFHKFIGLPRYQSFLFLVLVYCGLAFVISFSIYRHYEKDELVAKEKFANDLLIKNDILGEYYLSEIIEEIQDDRYVRSRLMSKLLARQNVREKIKRQFLSAYFKKYDIDVYLFDQAGNSMQSDLSEWSHQKWIKTYQNENYETDYPGIYFIEDRDENVRNKYVCFLDIGAYGQIVGHIVLELTLKKFIPASVFPELLLESKYYLGSKEQFDYAVFKNDEILYKQGRNPFENALTISDLDDPALFDDGVEKDGFHYFGLRTTDDRTIVIASPTYETRAILTNFSFQFLILLFHTGLLVLLVSVFSSKGQFNLSTKIQIYLGLSFLIPMSIVSVALTNTLNRSYKEEIDRNFQKKSYNIAENLIDESEAYFSNQINIDVYTNEVVRIAAIVQSDINIYDLKGRLVSSSQPEIYQLGLMSTLVDPKAQFQIVYLQEQNIIESESIGKLDFKTSYTAIRSYQDGHLLAVLGVPYFDSKNHLRRQQIEVFNNLVIIFSFIFLLAVFGGNLIVNQLVGPLKQIGDKIRRTSLQEVNEPIKYDAEDEIGSLVREYNQMIQKLEENKQALAISQKESAWKEIARQVAHEIKNPLTPMRLKVQQMMRGIAPADKTYRTLQTLITQIDSLSSIADSFSEFAKMPAPKYERVELIELIEKTIYLYQGTDVKLEKNYLIDEVFVTLDPNIFSRTLTNIFLNALQATEGQIAEVSVTVYISGNKVVIALHDNGNGIPDEQKENIFTPYFSTKSTGSGIGLAVAKKGIENAGGNIWFESEEGKGTTFYISLPILKS